MKISPKHFAYFSISWDEPFLCVIACARQRACSTVKRASGSFRIRLQSRSRSISSWSALISERGKSANVSVPVMIRFESSSWFGAQNGSCGDAGSVCSTTTL
eukprot:3895671-Pleurochrysis_carterae.AAC.1